VQDRVGQFLDPTADGIRPVFFGPRPECGIPFPSTIVEVTPAEYELIRDGSLALPDGWQMGEEFRKDSVQVVAH